MPQVFEIAVERSRTAQPREYESSYAKLALKAQIAENEDWLQEAGDLMDQARDLVFKNLGLEGKLETKTVKPPKTTSASDTAPGSDEHRQLNKSDVPPPSRSTETPDDTRKRLSEMLARDIKDAVPRFTDDEVAILMDDERTTVSKAAKLEMERRTSERHEPPADLPNEEEGAKDRAAVPDVPPEQEDAAASDFPEDEPAAKSADSEKGSEELSASDLQGFLTHAIQHRGLDVTKAKGVLKEFDAGRVRDIKDSDRAQFKDRIEALLNEGK